jgi:hypothetical protein
MPCASDPSADRTVPQKSAPPCVQPEARGAASAENNSFATVVFLFTEYCLFFTKAAKYMVS